MMKTAIMITADNVYQISLEPESEADKIVCAALLDGTRDIYAVQGYEIIATRGNYLRQSADRAACIVCRPKVDQG